jgi:hypothetical protein
MALPDRGWTSEELEVVADPAVGRGGCLVQTDLGRMDVGLDGQFSELARTLLGEDGGGLADALGAIPAWIYSIYLGVKRGREKRVGSHLDQITGMLWIAFGISTFALVLFGHMINYEMNPVILIGSAVPTLVSGVIIRFRPLIIGGISFWIFGVLCFLVSFPWEYIVGAAAVAIGFLIPGILLRTKKEV